MRLCCDCKVTGHIRWWLDEVSIILFKKQPGSFYVVNVTQRSKALHFPSLGKHRDPSWLNFAVDQWCDLASSSRLAERASDLSALFSPVVILFAPLFLSKLPSAVRAQAATQCWGLSQCQQKQQKSTSSRNIPLKVQVEMLFVWLLITISFIHLFMI